MINASEKAKRFFNRGQVICAARILVNTAPQEPITCVFNDGEGILRGEPGCGFCVPVGDRVIQKTIRHLVETERTVPGEIVAVERTNRINSVTVAGLGIIGIYRGNLSFSPEGEGPEKTLINAEIFIPRKA
jgi:hypothetical protein